MTQDLNCPEMLRASEAIDNGDYLAAFELLLPLVADGNPKAELNLATFYHLGLGVAPNGEKAVDLYLRVGAMNIQEEHISSLAYHNLSTLYVCGCPPIPRDVSKAGKYAQLAKDMGFEM